MGYFALASLVVAVVTLVLGFTGVLRGAAHFSNAAFLLSLALLAAASLTSVARRRLHHH